MKIKKMAIPKIIKKVIPKPVKEFLKHIRSALRGLLIWKDYHQFKKQFQTAGRDFRLEYNDIWPCFGDKTAETDFERHYVYHLAWAARCVKEIMPTRHIDIGSRLFFSTILSAFVPTDFYDYRPADIVLSNFGSYKGDVVNLPFKDNELSCVSCLHTLEHIGLGRYGDPINPNGDMIAMRELSRVVASGGNLLVVVPTGKEMRIQFNAHRIYSYDGLIKSFPDFKLHSFSYIPEESKREPIINNTTAKDIKDDIMGCGCFWFIKK